MGLRHHHLIVNHQLYSDWNISRPNIERGFQLAIVSAVIRRNPPVTTVYTVEGTTTAGGCTSTVSRTITVNSTPLPVELISFDAAWSGKTPVLTWATASEKNSAYFDVERSYDGQSFEKISQSPAAGNSSIRIDYRFADTRFGTANPVVYYRLQQVDVSGETSYSPVRVLQVATSGNAFKAAVFPNPYTNTAAVRFHSSGDTAVKISLHNILGQTIFTKLVTGEAGAQEVALPLVNSLPLGVYYLTIQQGNQQQVVRINHQQ